MRYEWLDGFCLSMPGAEREDKLGWEATLYRIGGKMFAMVGEDNHKKPIVTLKCEPAFGLLLRGQYPDITPGYHMNKIHWNSVDLNGSVPDDTVRQMIEMSYGLVLHALPRKTQQAITGAPAE